MPPPWAAPASLPLTGFPEPGGPPAAAGPTPPPPPGYASPGVPPAPLDPPDHDPAAGTGPDPAPLAPWAEGADLGDDFGRSLVPGRRRRTLVTVVAVALVVALLVGGGVAFLITSGPGPIPLVSPAARSLLHSSLRAAERKGSFHYVSRFTSQGATQTTVGDAGRSSGRQVITIGPHTFTVLVVGSACYFRGDARELVDQLGLPTATATAQDGQWIFLSPGDAPYQSVYAAVTAHSALADNIAFVPHRPLDPTTLSGRRVLGIAGPMTNVSVNGQTQKAKGSATFYVAASDHVPVRYSEQGKLDNQQSAFTMTFSKWGEPVTVTAPQGAVSFASLGSTGPGPSVTSPQGPPTLVSYPA